MLGGKKEWEDRRFFWTVYLRRFFHSFTVNSPIEKVWKFYTDINHLKVITPGRLRLEILEKEGDSIVEGATCLMQARLVTKSRWHSRITRFEPYEYVDEMTGGMFKKWIHLHKFLSMGIDKTEVCDQIDFELPFGVLGRALEGYAMNKLGKIFEYRKNATISELEGKSQV